MKNKKILICIVLAISLFAVYGQVWNFDFVNYDDNTYVFQNNFVKNGLKAESIHDAMTSTRNSLWIPAARLSYLVESSLFGIKAGWFHIDNVIIHIVNSILLFLLLNKLTGSIWRSAFAVFFFALHPLRVESVAWVTERKDVLSLFFLIISIWMYTDYTIKRKLSIYLLSLIFFFMSLISKPMTVTLPFLLMLLDFWPLGRFMKKGKYNKINFIITEKIPYLLISLIISFITFHANKTVLNPNDIISLTDRLFNIPVSFASYIGELIFPYNLAFFYPFNHNILTPLNITLSLLLISGITIYCYLNIKKAPFMVVGWLWFIAALLPVSGIIQAGTQSMADHFTYIPSIGFAVLLSWGFYHFFSGMKNRSMVFIALSCPILLWLSAASFLQTGTWKNSETLFNHAIKVTKDNEIAEVNLAGTYFQAGDFSGAVNHYRETLRINPRNGVAHFNLGNIMLKSGEYESAVNEFNSALETVKDNPFLYRNLASALTKLGRTQEAEQYLMEYRRLRSLMGQKQ